MRHAELLARLLWMERYISNAIREILMAQDADLDIGGVLEELDHVVDDLPGLYQDVQEMYFERYPEERDQLDGAGADPVDPADVQE